MERKGGSSNPILSRVVGILSQILNILSLIHKDLIQIVQRLNNKKRDKNGTEDQNVSLKRDQH